MNHIYRIIWSRKHACWQVAQETASAHSVGSQSAGTFAHTFAHTFVMGILTLGASLGSTWANPTGGQISAGTGRISQSANSTTVQQSSQNLAINWNSFSVGANQSVNFVQPSSSAAVLNRVTGTEASSILGRVSANGQVFILNPNGILFGKDAQVNVGGLVASTLGMSDGDFMARNYKFSSTGAPGTHSGRISNQGSLNATGGTLALIAPIISNTGSLSANGGSVLLAAADQVTLTLQNQQLTSYTLNRGSLQSLIDSGGLIQANGGQVIVTARALDALSKSVINQTGVIEAQTVSTQNGVVKLIGDMDVGTLNFSGRIDASAPTQGSGGFVETSAAHVKIADSARVSTLSASGKGGQWLIDPADYTIAASGGDITGATLGTNLATTDVTIQSTAGTVNTNGNGDIHVNDTVTWSSGQTLTLIAQSSINVNKTLDASGGTGGKLVLRYGQSSAAGTGSSYNVSAPIHLKAGQNFSTQQGSTSTQIDFTVITSLGSAGNVTGSDLQGINGNLSGNFVLGADIDASDTFIWNSGAGFKPLGGNGLSAFTGKFDGLGHTISGLTVLVTGAAGSGTQNGTTVHAGLFGINAGTIQNVGLVNAGINGTGGAGVNGTNGASGTNGGNAYVGALSGKNGGIINNSYASVGVVVGYGGNSGSGDLSDNATSRSGNAGAVYAGGLAGENEATITNGYFTGSVAGTGGRAGNSRGVSGSGGSAYAGGVAGQNAATISSSYSTGTVSGAGGRGGMAFMGTNSPGQGPDGSTFVAGFAGRLFGANAAVVNSYWNTQTSQQSVGIGDNGASQVGVTGLTTAQMEVRSSFTGFDFTTPIWKMPTAGGNPCLAAFASCVGLVPPPTPVPAPSPSPPPEPPPSPSQAPTPTTAPPSTETIPASVNQATLITSVPPVMGTPADSATQSFDNTTSAATDVFNNNSSDSGPSASNDNQTNQPTTEAETYGLANRKLLVTIVNKGVSSR